MLPLFYTQVIFQRKWERRWHRVLLPLYVGACASAIALMAVWITRAALSEKRFYRCMTDEHRESEAAALEYEELEELDGLATAAPVEGASSSSWAANGTAVEGAPWAPPPADDDRGDDYDDDDDDDYDDDFEDDDRHRKSHHHHHHLPSVDHTAGQGCYYKQVSTACERTESRGWHVCAPIRSSSPRHTPTITAMHARARRPRHAARRSPPRRSA